MKPGEDLRRVVLDASLELIASNGLAAFSMREVARRAGVSHQAPYHHFADREAILAALVAEGFQQLRAKMAAARGRSTTPAAQLAAIGKAYVAFALANPAQFKLMFRSEWVSAEDHGEAKACADSAFNLLVEVAGGVAQARGGESDPKLSLGAWSLAHGLATLMLEGKFEQHWGKSRRLQQSAANAVLEQFADFLAGAG